MVCSVHVVGLHVETSKPTMVYYERTHRIHWISQPLNLLIHALSRPSTGFSLKVTSRSFRCTPPYLWNQLPGSFRQPLANQSSSLSSHFPHVCKFIIFTIATLIIRHHSFAFTLQDKYSSVPQILPISRLLLPRPPDSLYGFADSFSIFFCSTILVLVVFIFIMWCGS